MSFDFWSAKVVQGEDKACPPASQGANQPLTKQILGHPIAGEGEERMPARGGEERTQSKQFMDSVLNRLNDVTSRKRSASASSGDAPAL